MVDADAIRAGYAFSGPALELEALVVDDKPDPQTPVLIPLSLLNRHGLVAGATGTGKIVSRDPVVLAQPLLRNLMWSPPKDVHPDVLAQLGNQVQHAARKR